VHFFKVLKSVLSLSAHEISASKTFFKQYSILLSTLLFHKGKLVIIYIYMVDLLECICCVSCNGAKAHNEQEIESKDSVSCPVVTKCTLLPGNPENGWVFD